MKKQRAEDGQIVRSGARIRESVRSLPKGHFQQIRQMFDKQNSSLSSSAKKLSTIYERQSSKPVPSHVLLKLPVTDDEKLQHTNSTTTTNNFNEQQYRDYLAEYHNFRLEMSNALREPEFHYASDRDESLAKQTLSLPVETQTTREPLTYIKSSSQSSTSLKKEDSSLLKPSSLSNHHRFSAAMEAAVNYTDSYETNTSNHLQRTGSSRQYASSLQRPVAVHAKPVFITTATAATPAQTSPLNRTPSMVSNEVDELHHNALRISKRAQSSTSLSSTGYDSNSSPSIKSNRHSIATNNSNDFIVHSISSSSASSSSSSSSSSDEQLRITKPWVLPETNPMRNNHFYVNSVYQGRVFAENYEPKTVVSRTQIQLNQPRQERRPDPIVRHATVFHSTIGTDLPLTPPSSASSSPSPVYEPIIGKTKNQKSSFVLQTTSFVDPNENKNEKKIRRYNHILAERVKIHEAAASHNRSFPLSPTMSTGFQVIAVNNEQQSAPITQTQREQSPLPIAENPLFNPLPPKKPPRTFEHENKYAHLGKVQEQQVPSPVPSMAPSPSVDLGGRRII